MTHYQSILSHPACKKLRKMAEKPFDLNQRNALTRDRLLSFACRTGEFDLMYGTQRVDTDVLNVMQELADQSQVVRQFREMKQGNVINRIDGYESEERMVLHTAARDLFGMPVHPEATAQAKTEKPFGRDLESAVNLNKELLEHLVDEQIYRIDHYLGKETVQNILMFRFANQIFEPAWSRQYIDHVQITVAERLGVEHRAGYFEQAGLLRDMFQNHMLQLAALVGMEPPVDSSAESVRDEKVKFMKSIRPFDLEKLETQLIKGQYSEGEVAGKKLMAYREEKGVAATSCTETYFAMKLFVDNWRWKDVPFYLQAGKRLGDKLTRIAVIFKKVPHSMFTRNLKHLDPSPNVLVFEIQPRQGISLLFQAKVPGAKMCLAPLRMELDYRDGFGTKMDEDYSTLILDCMLGDQTLYWRKDGVVQARPTGEMDTRTDFFERRQNMPADIGLIGLAVMGQNLVLNMNDHGLTVAVFNRTTAKVDEFMAGPARGTNIIPTHSIVELVECLKKPRRVMIMVKAGAVVDSFIDMLLPHLDHGDIIIDGGNSLYSDTNNRTRALAEQGILFIGTGISGGEEGARKGPSIMPGGNPAAWPHVKDIFQAIAARVDDEPCCDWVGEEGAGHFVKMVHNGIEYGDMQLVCEAYDFLGRGLGMDTEAIRSVFSEWNRGVLDSYLMEISADILGYKDVDGEPLVEKILDAAGQKGTGKWTGINALELGIPLTLIGEAVFARCLSAMKEERVKAAAVLPGPSPGFAGNREEYAGYVRDALYASKIISYAQGYMLMRHAAREYGWKLNYGGIALMWRGGCIIRSAFLGRIKLAFDTNPVLENLLLDDFFRAAIRQAQGGWRKVVAGAAELGVPIPAFASALSYYDGYRSGRLPANLLQAQRDYFGAHTYERVDKPRGEFFHTDWTGHGGKVSSNTYTV